MKCRAGIKHSINGGNNNYNNADSMNLRTSRSCPDVHHKSGKASLALSSLPRVKQGKRSEDRDLSYLLGKWVVIGRSHYGLQPVPLRVAEPRQPHPALALLNALTFQ